jgi:hypothetical protein
MKVLLLTALYLGTSFAQHGGSSGGTHPQMAPNPPSKAERDAIAKEEYKKNVADAATLLHLAAQLKADIENQTAQTVSATTVKEAGQIETLAQGIRNRLKH